MKMTNRYVLTSLVGCLLVIGCTKKTPGQKLDHAINSVEQTAHDAEKKYEAKKEAIKKKSDEAREDLADKIKP